MKRWLKRGALAFAAVVLLLVVVVFTATRPWFITAVVLPRAAKAIQTEIRVGDLAFSPTSRLQIADVRVGPTDAPLLQADLIRVRYSLFSALAGKVRVNEVRLDDATVHVLKRADGTTNLPVFPESTRKKKKRSKSEHEPTDVRVANVRVSGLTLIYEQRQGPNQEPLLLRLSDLSLDVPEIASGKEGTMALSGRVDEVAVGGIKGVNATLRGEGRLGLDATLAPSLVDLTLSVAFSQGAANAIDLGGRELRFDLSVASVAGGLEIRRVAVTELKAGRVEAALAVTGQVRREPAEVLLEVVADPIEAAVFDIAGALAGDIAFGQPTGSYRAQIRLQSPERMRRTLERILEQPWTAAASGQLELRSLSPRSETWKLHDLGPFDIAAEHDLGWDTTQKAVHVRTLKGRVGTEGRDLLSAELSQPLTVGFAGTTPSVQGDAVLALKAYAVPLSLANPFLPGSLPLSPVGGVLDADAAVSVSRQGADLAVAATARLSDVVLAAAGGARGAPFAIEAQVRATAADLQRVQAEQLDVVLRTPGSEPAEFRASGRFDREQGGEGTLRFGGIRQGLLGIVPGPLLATLPVERFAADGQLRWQVGKDFRPLTADARFGLAGVRLRNPEGDDELTATVAVQATASSEQIAITSSSLDVAIGGQQALQVLAEGSVGLTRAASTTRALAVTSHLIDVDRLLAFAKPLLALPPPAAPADPAPATVAPPAAPAAGPPTASTAVLPPFNGTVSLDLRRIVYKGLSAGLSGVAALSQGAEFKALTLRLPAGEITVDGSVAPEGTDWRARLTVSAAGEALAELASWSGQAIPVEPLENTALAIRFDGAAAPDASRVRVETLEVKLARVGRDPMLAVAVTRPLSLTRAKDGALSWTDTDFTLSATKLPVAMANAVLPADAGLRLDSGDLDAALEVALKADGLKAEVRGTFALADLAGHYGSQAFTAVRAEGAVQGRTTGADQVSVSRLETTVTAGTDRAVSLTGTLDWDRAKGGSGSLDAVLDVPVALRAAAIGGEQAARVQALAIALKVRAQMAPDNGPVQAEFGLGADGIRLADASGAALPRWAFQVAGKATLDKSLLVVDTLTLQSKTAERTLANLALSASIALPPVDGRSEARLTGDMLDVSGLLAVTVGAEPAESQKSERGKKKPEAPAEPSQEPGPFDTGKAVAEVTVDLRNLVYGEVKTDIACTARLEDSVVRVEPLQGSLNGAAFFGSARANLAVQGLDYAATFTLAPVDSGPFVRTFAPTLASTVQGSLSGLSFELAGQGITRPSLQRSLRGRVEAGAKDIVLQGLPGQATLAQKLSVPEIEKIQVTQVDILARVQDGKVHLDSFRETAPGHTMGANGVIGLDESLAVDIGLGIGGALQSRLSQHAAAGYVFRHFQQQGDYMVSPAPLPFGGTVRKPKFNRERFLAELGKAGASTLVRGLLEDKLGKTGGLGQALGALAPGGLTIPGLGTIAKPATDSGKAPTVSPTKQQGRAPEQGKPLAKTAEKAAEGAVTPEPLTEKAAEKAVEKPAVTVPPEPAAEKAVEKPAVTVPPELAVEKAVEKPAATVPPEPAVEEAVEKAELTPANPEPAPGKAVTEALGKAEEAPAVPAAGEERADETAEEVPAVLETTAPESGRGQVERPAKTLKDAFTTGTRKPAVRVPATGPAKPAEAPGAVPVNSAKTQPASAASPAAAAGKSAQEAQRGQPRPRRKGPAAPAARTAAGKAAAAEEPGTEEQESEDAEEQEGEDAEDEEQEGEDRPGAGRTRRPRTAAPAPAAPTDREEGQTETATGQPQPAGGTGAAQPVKAE